MTVFTKASLFGALTLALFAAPLAVEAGSISYDTPTNTWTVSGFTDVENTGIGWLAGGGGSAVGGSTSLGWFRGGGHWIGASGNGEDEKIFSDFYLDQTITIDVSNVTWTNASGAYFGDQGDGVFFFADPLGSGPGTMTLSTPLAEGAILNGTFAFTEASTKNNAILAFTPLPGDAPVAPVAPVPLPASLPLLFAGFGMVAATRLRGRTSDAPA